MNNKVRLFFLGMIASSAISGIIQDLYGKEAWIKHIEDYWVSSSITGPIHTFCLLYSLVALVNILKERNEENSSSD